MLGGMSSPPPLRLTGDDDTDEALALLRATQQTMDEALRTVEASSRQRQRLVLDLRARRVPFKQIAEAAGIAEQTVFKVHRDARERQAEQAVEQEAKQAAERQVPHPDPQEATA
jgi:hypothetical protein